ncbi:MAG: SH3 domain-containing protein [Clostridia bacterium]|nr:SH3 domain-containing protein [Clostridia bacterium]
MKRLMAMLLTLALVFSVMAAPAARAATYATATVKGGWLRLRAEPSLWAETISAYYTGTNVTILGGSGQWYHVSTPDGKTGYMHSDYLTITGSITGGQLDENTQAYVTSGNGKSVRMRTGPSKSYSTIASYPVGTPVTILISGDDWCKVRINGRTGYMMTEFLTTTNTGSGSATTGTTAYVTSANGLSVNLRSGASKLYGAIASYAVGTKVTVLEWGKTWSKIRVNNVTGYMMTEFLTTTAPSVVTSVVLSDSSVWPGETLYATVVPSGASVTYEWLNDKGTRLGTGSSYTVKSSDAGRRIRVRVTGMGASTGTATSGWATVQGDGYVSTHYTLTGVTISDTTPAVGQTLTAAILPVGATANVTWFRDDGVYVASGSTYTVHATDEGRRLYVRAEGTGSTYGSVTSSYTAAVTASTSASLTLRSVTISDTTPTVGQTLTVSLNPAGATASITWYRANGSVAGTGSSYTVQQTDLGSSLYVYAVGTGSTKGSAVSGVTGKVQGNAASTAKRINTATLSDMTPSVGQTITVSVDPAGATALITWFRDDDVILGYGASYTVEASDIGHTMYVWVEGYGDTTGSCTSAITGPVGGYVTTFTDLGW